jgi:hypothetical protein
VTAQGDFITVSITGASGSGSTANFDFLPNAGLAWLNGNTGGTAYTIYNNNLDPLLQMPDPVGGLPAGTTAGGLSNCTLVQLFNDILFPSVPPEYVIPTIAQTSTVTGIREVGSPMSQSVTVTGINNDASAYVCMRVCRNVNTAGYTQLGSAITFTQTLLSPLPAQFGYPNLNAPNCSYVYAYPEGSITVCAPSGVNLCSTMVYCANGDYNAGVPLKNNKGVTDTRTPAVRSVNAPQLAANCFSTGTSTVCGFYPFFYGYSSTQLTASQIQSCINAGFYECKCVAPASGAILMNFNITGCWPWFATYACNSTKTSWSEVGNPLNTGNIGSPTDLFAAPTTLPCNSDASYWSSVSFKIYPSNKVTSINTASIS